MDYGISAAGGSTPRKLDALNEAIRRYGALPFITLIEYPEFEAIVSKGETSEATLTLKRLTFKLERGGNGRLSYVEVK